MFHLNGVTRYNFSQVNITKYKLLAKAAIAKQKTVVEITRSEAPSVFFSLFEKNRFLVNGRRVRRTFNNFQLIGFK